MNLLETCQEASLTDLLGSPCYPCSKTYDRSHILKIWTGSITALRQGQRWLDLAQQGSDSHIAHSFNQMRPFRRRQPRKTEICRQATSLSKLPRPWLDSIYFLVLDAHCPICLAQGHVARGHSQHVNAALRGYQALADRLKHAVDEVKNLNASSNASSSSPPNDDLVPPDKDSYDVSALASQTSWCPTAGICKSFAKLETLKQDVNSLSSQRSVKSHSTLG